MNELASSLIRLTPTLTLRPLATDEAISLAASLAKMEPWRSLGSTAAGLAGYLTRADPGLRRHGVIHDGQLAGVVAVRSPWLRGAYLELLGMTAEQQRQGLGQAVIGWLTAEAARNGANLWVTVSAFNEPARRFYARQGFVPVGDLPDLVRAGSTEILLRLPPPADRR